MLHAKLGTTGLVVSRLSLGTMSFGEDGGNKAIARTREKDAHAIVGRAIASRRDELVVVTKAGWRTGEPQVSSVLIGASRLSQLDDNLAAAGHALTAGELTQRGDAARPVSDFSVDVTRVPDQPIINALAAKPGEKPDLKAPAVA